MSCAPLALSALLSLPSVGVISDKSKNARNQQQVIDWLEIAIVQLNTHCPYPAADRRAMLTVFDIFD